MVQTMHQNVGEVPPPEFGDPSYWENLYATAVDGGEDTYEWLLGWDQLSWLLEPLLARDTSRSVLHLGCGNSALSEDMYKAGYKCQTSVDISSSVIAHMAKRNIARTEMQWIAADATDLTAVLPSDEFALVIDKSTIDALFCHDDHALMIARFTKEAFRVTAPSGVYVCISLHSPWAVLPWLRRGAFHWRVRVVEIPDETSSSGSGSAARGRRGARGGHHVYLCSKRGPAAASLRSRWPALLERVTARPSSDLSAEDSSSGEESSGSSGSGGGGGASENGGAPAREPPPQGSAG